MTPIYKEETLSNYKTYCIQVNIDKGLSFLYSIFAIGLNILSDANTILHVQLALLGDLFNFEIIWSKETDHAGIDITLQVLWFTLYMSFCDTRHWDDEKDCWKEY